MLSSFQLYQPDSLYDLYGGGEEADALYLPVSACTASMAVARRLMLLYLPV